MLYMQLTKQINTNINYKKKAQNDINKSKHQLLPSSKLKYQKVQFLKTSMKVNRLKHHYILKLKTQIKTFTQNEKSFIIKI